MGDGTTAYNQLPYFLQQNIVGDETVAFTDTSAATASTNNGTYLSNIAPANNIKTLMTNIKQLLYNYNSQLTQLSTNFGSAQNHTFMDIPAARADSGNLTRLLIKDGDPRPYLQVINVSTGQAISSIGVSLLTDDAGRIAKINDSVTGPIAIIGWNRTTGRLYWQNDENWNDWRSVIAGNFRLDGTTLYIDL